MTVINLFTADELDVVEMRCRARRRRLYEEIEATDDRLVAAELARQVGTVERALGRVEIARRRLEQDAAEAVEQAVERYCEAGRLYIGGVEYSLAEGPAPIGPEARG